MITQSEFLSKYNVDEDKFRKAAIEWSELEAIYDHHASRANELLSTGNLISEQLRQIPQVHSLKIRVKDCEHLVEKIIRKRADDKDREITLDNYQKEITDLVGVRALHLFKDDWSFIHDAIKSIWDLHEDPIAYIRDGDNKGAYKEKGCAIKPHKDNYRSVHYLVESRPTKNLCIAEIQVRTIFEEGWSEIDHQLRYPYDLNNTILAEYIAIFNRHAGSADEMGTHLRRLKIELSNMEKSYKQQIEAKEKENEAMIKTLEDVKKKLKNAAGEKKEL